MQHVPPIGQMIKFLCPPPSSILQSSTIDVETLGFDLAFLSGELRRIWGSAK
jgi:hypothetical protein